LVTFVYIKMKNKNLYNRQLSFTLCVITTLLLSCTTFSQEKLSTKAKTTKTNMTTDSTNKSNEEWKKILPPEVYEIAREKGTERPFTGKYWNTYDTGTYKCAVCQNPLFKSNGKFESSCGWPSFFEPITKESIIYEQDNTYGMKRTEVMCGKCKSHLGHVFDDGPKPTGLRYCINGNVLNLQKEEK
jgi:peptide-methionine (R)-S-oxide reductase